MADQPAGSHDAGFSRFPGVQPFGDLEHHRKVFHGRDSEKYELFHTVLAERLTFVFSRSGLGKSSLINAGVLAPLRKKNFFPIVARVSGHGRAPVDAVYYGIQAALSQHRDTVYFEPSKEKWNKTSLWHFFKTIKIRTGLTELKPVLILDQFEELFTLHNPEDRKEFITDLAGLIRGIQSREHDPALSDELPDVKVVLVLREEFNPYLEELRDDIPGIYNAPFRLVAMTPEQAKDAMTKPASEAGEEFRTSGFTWDPRALELVVNFLSTTHTDSGEATQAEEIEPFQLQLVCQHIEDLAAEKGLNEITIDVLGGKDAKDRLKSIIGDFYTSSLERAADEFPNREGLQSNLQKLCEDGFVIQESGRRRLLEATDIEGNYGVGGDVLRKLVDLRLVREEPRVGDSYYELAHDTLVEPIKKGRDARLAVEATRKAQSAARRRGRFVFACAAAVAVAVMIGSYFYQQQKDLLAAKQVAAAAAEAAEAAERERVAITRAETERKAKEKAERDRLEADRAREEALKKERELEEELQAKVARNAAVSEGRAIQDTARKRFDQLLTGINNEITKIESAATNPQDLAKFEAELKRLNAVKFVAESRRAELVGELNLLMARFEDPKESSELVLAIVKNTANIYSNHGAELGDELKALRENVSVLMKSQPENSSNEGDITNRIKAQLEAINLLQADASVLDETIAQKYEKFLSEFANDMVEAELVRVEKELTRFKTSAQTYSYVKSDLYICEELDALPNFIPARGVGPEIEYKTERTRELQDLMKRTAIVTTSQNAINTDRKFGTTVISRLKVGGKAQFMTWVRSPGRTRMDLRLVTPKTKIQIWGKGGKRNFSTGKNTVRGVHKGYRLSWPETIRASYGVGIYEWQLRDDEGRKLCRARFEVY